MDIMIAENIRSYRMQRSLTREQLAEVLGVTPGAVYKWEAKLSVPDLSMIIEIADFFDTSVDALLGYEMKDNRLSATVLRLNEYLHKRNYAGLREAEKALKKYPNFFDIVHKSSILYRVFGMENKDKKLLRRSLELLEQSCLLLTQNADPKISELTICGEKAEVYLSLGEAEKAVEILKKNNSSGHYSDIIGQTLAADIGHTDESVTFLSEALLLHVTALIHTIMGYLNVYSAKRDYNSGQEILDWGIKLISGLRKADTPNFLDKTSGVFHIALAYLQIMSGELEEAKNSLEKAKMIASCFDSAPNYDGCSIRFITQSDNVSAYDNLGTTAINGLDKAIKEIENESLSTLWKEIRPSDI